MLYGICFSKDFISIHDEGKVGGMKELIRKIMEVGSLPNAADFFPILGGMDVQERKQGEHAEGSTKEDLLNVLLANDFSSDAINHLIFDLFVAGSDSTSSTVEWLMSELIRNEEVMNKLHEELAREIKK
ncbi:Cytochrome p450 [Thalictrum thalictroides]|uniref:Cytochrome p450 n=1 Tax=Thalictrum thalictroides TaxID=46969 RepID=A0A7J6W8W1_THATH|nr:Cytochrome p450 [Thalictrum thalictroides]